MNCVSEKCKHVRWEVIKDDRLKYFSHILVPHCELGKTVSYPFGDNGKRNICECYERVESEERHDN